MVRRQNALQSRDPNGRRSKGRNVTEDCRRFLWTFECDEDHSVDYVHVLCFSSTDSLETTKRRNSKAQTMDSVTASESEDEQRIRCGSSLIKCFIILVNLVFMVIGFALISIVVWIHVNRESLVYIRLFEDPPPHSIPQQQQQQQLQQQHIPSGVVQRTTVIVVVVVVVAVVAFGFLGCCGASVDSVCFLCLCVVLITSVLTAEIVIASMFPNVKEKMYDDLSLRMHHQVRNEYNRTTFEAAEGQGHSAEGQGHSAVADHHHQLTVTWNTLQMRFNCCGASGPRDFRFSVWYNQTNDGDGLYVPKSCCVLVTEPGADQHPVVRNEPFCQIEALLFEENDRPLVELHPYGCHSALVSYIDSYFRHPLAIVMYVSTVLLQVLDVLFCCVLSQRIRRRLAEIDLSESIDGETDGSEED